MTLRLQGTLSRLVPYGVQYCTVSYGAGGSTRKGTAEWVRRIRQDYGVDCAPHLTHVSHGRDEVRSIVGEYLSAGVQRIVAIRGDLPPDGMPESARAQGYGSTVEMVADLRAIGVREVTVGAPSTVAAIHPPCVATSISSRRSWMPGQTRPSRRSSWTTTSITGFATPARSSESTIVWCRESCRCTTYGRCSRSPGRRT